MYVTFSDTSALSFWPLPPSYYRVIFLPALGHCHHFNISCPVERRVIKSQVALMVLCFHGAAGGTLMGAAIYSLVPNLNSARLKLDFLLLSFSAFWPQTVKKKKKSPFIFSWASLCATGAAPVINIAAPVGSGSFKIVFLRLTSRHIKIYIMFSEE